MDEKEANLHHKILTMINQGYPKNKIEEAVGLRFSDKITIGNHCVKQGCNTELDITIFFKDVKYLTTNLKSHECDHILHEQKIIKNIIITSKTL